MELQTKQGTDYYYKQYYLLEDGKLKRDFREEFCANCGWCKSTFYNRIKTGYFSQTEAKEFTRLYNLYVRK